MGWVTLALALLQAAPQIMAMILQVEQLIGAGNGALKKQLVMHAVTLGSKDAGFLDKIGALIDAHVATLNEAGVLAKMNAPLPAALTDGAGVVSAGPQLVAK